MASCDVDSGLGDLIVGTFTIKKDRYGDYEIDEMPWLAKRQGNCVFYDPNSGLCNAYGYRPTICRRFPYEVEFKDKKNSAKPFARFLPWTGCATKTGKKFEPAVRQMVADAVEDENVSFEDAMLLPDYVEELRELGFDKYLPPPEECPV